MKLYTEEQVIQMIESSYLHGFERAHDYKDVKEHILKSVPPIKLQSVTTIELPSDEELSEEGQKQWGNVHSVGVVGWIDGSKWMRDKIGGNK